MPYPRYGNYEGGGRRSDDYGGNRGGGGGGYGGGGPSGGGGGMVTKQFLNYLFPFFPITPSSMIVIN